MIPADGIIGIGKTEKADKPLISKALSVTSILYEGEIGG